ncbi:hypothetical protein [Pseudomonas boanensis]|uniref:hypothetical protein n=1 Tax=Metapseudomonas boanensis TaxID=2822138 RepID=UPI0035D47A94
MIALWSLFAPRRQLHCFALLDDAGICRELRQANEAPAGGHWVQVDGICLSWLDRPLPPGALVAPVVGQSERRRALAA